jgi:ribosome-associated heat shock protein Hsp15
MVRIDKYLWCVRIYKSRTLATDACDGGKVKLDGSSVKPSYHIKPGDTFTVQLGFIKRTYRVKALLEKRLSAKLVTEYIEDLTPQEELDKLKTAKIITYESRFKGMGRPTKKDRRLINQIRIKN